MSPHPDCPNPEPHGSHFVPCTKDWVKPGSTVLCNGADVARLPDDTLRTRILTRLREMDVWDQQAEQARDALLAVMGWHQPMQKYEQVFTRTGFNGDRDRGVRCRSDDEDLSQRPCHTVRVIAESLGLTDDRPQLLPLAWPHGIPSEAS